MVSGFLLGRGFMSDMDGRTCSTMLKIAQVRWPPPSRRQARSNQRRMCGSVRAFASSSMQMMKIGLREAVAVAEEGHDHAVGVEVSVDPDGGLDFGEVFDILAQDLFSEAFVVVLVGVGFSSERQGDEVGSCPCGLVQRCCVKTCQREFADSTLGEEGSLGFDGNDVMTGLVNIDVLVFGTV